MTTTNDDAIINFSGLWENRDSKCVSWRNGYIGGPVKRWCGRQWRRKTAAVFKPLKDGGRRRGLVIWVGIGRTSRAETESLANVSEPLRYGSGGNGGLGLYSAATSAGNKWKAVNSDLRPGRGPVKIYTRTDRHRLRCVYYTKDDTLASSCSSSPYRHRPTSAAPPRRQYTARFVLVVIATRGT